MRICDRRRREGVYIQINSHKKSDGQIRSEIEKGRATRKGMDEGKGGKTRSMQERERVRTGGNQSGRKRKNGISRATAIPGKKITRRGGAELCRKQRCII